MAYELRFEPPAERDLDAIADWIESAAGPEVALQYIARLEDKCRSLADFPNRGTPRPEAPGLRSIPFERRATILYSVDDQVIRIWGIFHSGRRLELD